MLVGRGFSPTKLWFSVTQSEQRTRFAIINAMRFFLNQFNYEGKDSSVVYPADPLPVQLTPRRLTLTDS